MSSLTPYTIDIIATELIIILTPSSIRGEFKGEFKGRMYLKQGLWCFILLTCAMTSLLLTFSLNLEEKTAISSIDKNSVNTRSLLMEDLNDMMETVGTVHSLMTTSQNTDVQNYTQMDNCNPLQISFYVESFHSITKMIRALKSLLFYRQSPIVLRVIVSNRDVSLVVETIFRTWELKYFDFHIHNIHLQPGAPLPIQRLHVVMPVTVAKVIFLDVNAIFNTDIAELWRYFDEMQSKDKIFGTVEAPITTTTAKGVEHCTFDLQVLLVNLKKVRDNVELSKMLLSKDMTTDKINDLIRSHLGYKLPCKWNIRIGKCNTECDSDVAGMLVSDNVGESGNDSILHAKYLQQLWMQLDSHLLQTQSIMCKKSEEKRIVMKHPNTKAIKAVDSCMKLFQESVFTYRTHKYFIGGTYKPISQYDVTLITQLSFDRLSILFKLLTDHWKGPVSATIYCTDYESWQVMEQFNYDDKLRKRKNIAIHIVYISGTHFPVNYLRNVALSSSLTPFVFLSDCDFLTSHNLYEYLKKSAEVLQSNKAQPKKAMIVPAFESLKYNFKFPLDKKTLLNQCRRGQFQIFHKTWFSGHGPTNYNKWAVTRHPYPIKWADYFEPYILIERDAPVYAEQFFGYGFNKASHIMEVKASGYEFVVLPNGYVIHNPHPVTSDRNAFVDKGGLHSTCIEGLKRHFVYDLYEKYGRSCLKNLPGKITSLKYYSNITL